MPPTEAPKEKTPLEEKGHLNRTQLYILLAILSVAVLGLCGYIVWSLYNPQTVSEQVTDTSADETQTPPDEPESINIQIGDVSTQLIEGEEFVIQATSVNDEVGVDVGDLKIALSSYNSQNRIILLEIIARRMRDGSFYAETPPDLLEIPVGEKSCTPGTPLVYDVSFFYCFETRTQRESLVIETEIVKEIGAWQVE